MQPLTRVSRPLTRVRRATARRRRAGAEWSESIRAAHSEGASLREIAKEAGVSHVRVLQIVRRA